MQPVERHLKRTREEDPSLEGISPPLKKIPSSDYLTNLPTDILRNITSFLNWRGTDMANVAQTCKKLKLITEFHPKYALTKILFIFQQNPFLYFKKSILPQDEGFKQDKLFKTVEHILLATYPSGSDVLNPKDLVVFNRLLQSTSYHPFTRFLQLPHLSQKESIFSIIKQMIKIYLFSGKKVMKIGQDEKLKDHINSVFKHEELAIQFFNQPLKEWKKEQIEQIDWDIVAELYSPYDKDISIESLSTIDRFFSNTDNNDLAHLYKSDCLNEKFILFLMFCSDRIDVETTESLFQVFEDKKSNRDFILKCVRINCFTLQCVSAEICNDREVVLEAVKFDGRALWDGAMRFWGDREIVLEAVKTCGSALEVASNELLNEREFLIAACKTKNKDPLNHFPIKFANDREFFLEIVEYDIDLLKHASPAIRDDEEMMIKAIRFNENAIGYASDRLKSRRDIALLAVRVKGKALRHLLDQFGEDEEIILEAIENDVYVLNYLSEKLRTNKEFIMKAFRKNCGILTCAYYNIILKELLGDRNIILEAIQHKYFVSNKYPSFLSLAPKHIRSDRELMLLAIRRCVQNVCYIDESLWQDSLFIAELEVQNQLIKNFIGHRAICNVETPPPYVSEPIDDRVPMEIDDPEFRT